MAKKRKKSFFSWLGLGSENEVQQKETEQQPESRVQDNAEGLTDVIETSQQSEKAEKVPSQSAEKENSQYQTVDVKAAEIVTLSEQTVTVQEIDEQKKTQQESGGR